MLLLDMGPHHAGVLSSLGGPSPNAVTCPYRSNDDTAFPAMAHPVYHQIMDPPF
jgi:hypothetical protein